jgi:hypothetical protein
METIELSRMERERESPVISSAVHSADFYNVRERSDLWAQIQIPQQLKRHGDERNMSWLSQSLIEYQNEPRHLP